MSRKKFPEYYGPRWSGDSSSQWGYANDFEGRRKCPADFQSRPLFNHFLFQYAGSLPQPPFVDYLDVEAPVAADLETGQLSLLQKPIDHLAMYSQVPG